MRLKAVFCLCLCFLLALCGCGKKQASNSSSTVSQNSAVSEIVLIDEAEKQNKTELSLACSVTDSFNPYTAVTALNRNLAPLMYEPLISLDSSFTPQYRLASKIDVSGTTVTVTLRSASFSDGSSITADDVVYCANRAMKSGTRYEYALDDVKSVSAASYNTVVFSLRKADPYFANQLDFPIYKANSDKESSSDNIEIPPVSSGRYVLNSDKTELEYNRYYFGETPKVKTIKLINTPDDEALTHNLEIGNITYHYSDLSNCQLSQVRGRYKTVNSNNLIYLGANMKSGLMINVEMRQAVSAALDRIAITESAYYQNAVATFGIFHPKWAEGNSLTTLTQNQINENVYLALLDKIGYNKKDNSGYYQNQNGEKLTLTLVCYKDNPWRLQAAELIKSQLKVAGIKVELKKYSWSDYTYALKKGHFDIYLAEVQLGNNMDITELVTKGGTAAYGISYKATSSASSITSSTTSSEGTATSSTASSTSSKTEEVKDLSGDTARTVERFYNGKATITDVATAFSGEMPIIPICYRTGIVSYASGVSGISPDISDIYRGIENATLK